MKKRSRTPFEAILGLAPWSVWKGYGSYLFFDFGQKRRLDRETLAGQYVLEIGPTQWVIHHRTEEVADCEASDKKIKQSIKHFERRKLLEILLRSHWRRKRTLYSARFSFEGHWSIDVYMYERGEWDAVFFVRSASHYTTYSYAGELSTKRRPNQWPNHTVAPRGRRATSD